jgi:ABC-type glycerol-3-phosphate transport system substrate-binding protein
MLAYNQAAFDAAGLAYPSAGWTLDELIDTAHRLAGGTGERQRYGFAASSGHTGDIRFFLQHFGAALVTGTGDTAQPTFTGARVVQALRAYLALLRDTSPHKQLQGFTRQWMPDAQALIAQGRVGMWFDYGFDTDQLRRQPSDQVRVAVVPPPLGQRALSADDFFVDGLFISAKTQYVQACWTWLKALSEDSSGIRGSFPARISVAESQAFQAHAAPGAAKVYSIYRAALDRSSEQVAESDPRRTPIDFFWFYRAADRALQGADLERELDDAQALTEQYLVCVRAGQKASACARQVDPHYGGWQSAEQP